jgi:hypothetical protein
VRLCDYARLQGRLERVSNATFSVREGDIGAARVARCAPHGVFRKHPAEGLSIGHRRLPCVRADEERLHLATAANLDRTSGQTHPITVSRAGQQIRGAG